MNSAFWVDFVLRIIIVLLSRLDDEALRSVKASCNSHLLANCKPDVRI